MTWARLASVATALLCLAAAVYLQQGAQAAGDAREATRAAREGRFEEAVRLAREVERAPADLRARLTEARALAAMRRLEAADAAYAAVARRDPNNWIVQLEWARATILIDFDAAVARLRRAHELNPRLVAPARLLGQD